MRRKVMEQLINWKDKGCEKPYMIIGARQVGKTYIIDEFCKNNFEEYLYVNLERDAEIKDIFDESIDPDLIIRQIGFLKNRPIDIDKTVIFIDEVQLSERAIMSLKYFAENSVNYKIIVAGSLLGVALNRFRSSFPVGKVKRYYMYPMDFEEFLLALGQDELVKEIYDCYWENKKMFEAVHDKLMNLYKDYIYVGGMPDSVLSYIDVDGDLNYYSRDIKRDILDDYLADMNKYTTNSEALKIKQVFQSIPSQLGRDNNKFSYKLIAENGKKAVYGTSIDWLLSSNLVNRATMIEVPRIPLKTYHKENMFKIYMGDTGLLSEMADMTPYDLHSAGGKLFSGMITENYIAQTLTASGTGLYYWRSGNSAEIDFLVNIEGEIIPIEVKASTNTKSKALKVYMEKYNPPYAIKVSGKNFGYNGLIKSVPLYAAHLIGRRG
ncbi:MAG: AAA family ATPase [Tissierellales bacterium]|jgi:predicted AAA+ superfamily ATPase|nr:AAA family ATPase [Tissierellales bacterium]